MRGPQIHKIPKDVPHTERLFKNIKNYYTFEEIIEFDKNQIDGAEEYLELFLISLMCLLYKSKYKSHHRSVNTPTIRSITINESSVVYKVQFLSLYFILLTIQNYHSSSSSSALSSSSSSSSSSSLLLLFK